MDELISYGFTRISEESNVLTYEGDWDNDYELMSTLGYEEEFGVCVITAIPDSYRVVVCVDGVEDEWDFDAFVDAVVSVM